MYWILGFILDHYIYVPYMAIKYGTHTQITNK